MISTKLQYNVLKLHTLNYVYTFQVAFCQHSPWQNTCMLLRITHIKGSHYLVHRFVIYLNLSHFLYVFQVMQLLRYIQLVILFYVKREMLWTSVVIKGYIFKEIHRKSYSGEILTIELFMVPYSTFSSHFTSYTLYNVTKKWSNGTIKSSIVRISPQYNLEFVCHRF